MSRAQCDDCGKWVVVPDTHPVDYAYCAECHSSGKQWPPLVKP